MVHGLWSLDREPWSFLPLLTFIWLLPHTTLVVLFRFLEKKHDLPGIIDRK